MTTRRELRTAAGALLLGLGLGLGYGLERGAAGGPGQAGVHAVGPVAPRATGPVTAGVVTRELGAEERKALEEKIAMLEEANRMWQGKAEGNAQWRENWLDGANFCQHRPWHRDRRIRPECGRTGRRGDGVTGRRWAHRIRRRREIT